MGITPQLSAIAAVVVLFHPDDDVVANIASYAAQVHRVFAVDNTPEPDDALVAALRDAGVVHHPLGENRGIAAALNAGCRLASDEGYGWVLTMDQDSAAPQGFVPTLGECIQDDAALVAPLWEQVGGLPETARAGCAEIEWGMTSGTLLRLDAWKSVGGFREELFIDQVDNEFCFRCLRNGWRLFQSGEAVLRHRQGTLTRAALGFYVTDYPAVRRYYMARNTLAVAREYGGEHPDWVTAEKRQWRRDLAKIVLGEPHKLDKLRKILEGRRDFRAGRFGRYEDIHR